MFDLRYIDIPFVSNVVDNVLTIISVIFLLINIGGLFAGAFWYFYIFSSQLDKQKEENRVIIETRRNDLLNDISHFIYELRNEVRDLPKHYVSEVLDDEK